MARNIEESSERAAGEDKLSAVLMLIAVVALLTLHILSIVAGPLGPQRRDTAQTAPSIQAEGPQPTESR